MKIIAISLRKGNDKHGKNVDVLEHDYVKYFEQYNVCLLPVPNISKHIKYYNASHIILSGGDLSVIREQAQKQLLDIAIEKKLPVFGICQGMQYINKYFQGRISSTMKNHVNINHKIMILKKEYIVNSYHHKCVYAEDLSKTLKGFAFSDDGIIEGLFHPSLPIAGVQWHPERSAQKINLNLIDHFINRKSFWKVRP